MIIVRNPYTQAKLLSTQPEIEFEYSFMLNLLYKMTADEVVVFLYSKCMKSRILRIYTFLQKCHFCVVCVSFLSSLGDYEPI